MVVVIFLVLTLAPLTSVLHVNVGFDLRSLLNSTAATDVPVLYSPTAFDNASLNVPEVSLSPDLWAFPNLVGSATLRPSGSPFFSCVFALS